MYLSRGMHRVHAMRVGLRRSIEGNCQDEHHAVGEAKSSAVSFSTASGWRELRVACCNRSRRGHVHCPGIETSCDDTGAAVVRSDGAILGEALASQHEIHECYGGVVQALRTRTVTSTPSWRERSAGGLSAADVDALRSPSDLVSRFAYAWGRPLHELLPSSIPSAVAVTTEAHCLSCSRTSFTAAFIDGTVEDGLRQSRREVRRAGTPGGVPLHGTAGVRRPQILLPRGGQLHRPRAR